MRSGFLALQRSDGFLSIPLGEGRGEGASRTMVDRLESVQINGDNPPQICSYLINPFLVGPNDAEGIFFTMIL
ncbi:Uncharacterised protein [Kluyvera intermedia]|nr:Uncharacterised protein [Kluyvera intermedia]